LNEGAKGSLLKAQALMPETLNSDSMMGSKTEGTVMQVLPLSKMARNIAKSGPEPKLTVSKAIT